MLNAENVQSVRLFIKHNYFPKDTLIRRKFISVEQRYGCGF